jgi:acyl-CoA synthetase (AMP-forming)/AMP-acid ligase II
MSAGTPPRTLPEALRQSAGRDPARPCFVQGQHRTSYEELDRRSDAVAGALVEAGIEPGERVVLLLNNSLQYLVAYYGILKAGAVVVPHYPEAKPRTLHHVVSHCRAAVVVLEGRNAGLLRDLLPQLPSLRLVISNGEPAQPELPPARVVLFADLAGSGLPVDAGRAGPDDLASIVYTSGTTGRPKGVMLAHRNQLANVESIVAYLELGPEDSIGMVLPFFYVYGNSVLQTHIRAGGTIVQLGSMAFVAAVVKGIQQHRCSGFSGVPSTFVRLSQFSKLDQYDLGSLRYVTQAGGPMTPALTATLRRLLPRARIFVMYGQTEASARLSYLPPEDLDRKPGSAGIGIPGVTLSVMDKKGRELPRGQVGEIVARGENIMRGYWEDPEETARVLRPEGLRTGDLARMDDEGYIFIVGRGSDMIKSGAHRIGPKEIEEVVEQLPQVAQCAVVGVPDELLGEAIAAFVVPATGAEVSRRSVMRACHENLPRFKLPAHVRVVASLPRTPSGKLRRRELREWFARPDPEPNPDPDPAPGS